MKFIDWFAGIGGFRLGMEAAGHECVAYSEIDPYACAVYNKRWPGTLNLGDITKLDPALIPPADIWTGGIPCQPFSLAGKRDEDDERNLWALFYTVLCSAPVRPRKLFLENVPGFLASRTAWDFLASIATIGFDAEWAVVSARDVGAPHRRDRVWIVATHSEVDTVWP